VTLTKSQRELLADMLELVSKTDSHYTWLDVRESRNPMRLWHLTDPGRGWTPRNVINLANAGYVKLDYTFGSGSCRIQFTHYGCEWACGALAGGVAQ
jgi:hypothetical protein